MKISNNNLGVTIPKPLYFEKTSKISQQHHKVLENIATLVDLSVFSNIMNGDSLLLFHIFKVNIYQFCTKIIMKFYLSVFPENRPFRESCKKAGLELLLIFSRIWSKRNFTNFNFHEFQRSPKNITNITRAMGFKN